MHACVHVRVRTIIMAITVYKFVVFYMVRQCACASKLWERVGRLVHAINVGPGLAMQMHTRRHMPVSSLVNFLILQILTPVFASLMRPAIMGYAAADSTATAALPTSAGADAGKTEKWHAVFEQPVRSVMLKLSV